MKARSERNIFIMARNEYIPNGDRKIKTEFLHVSNREPEIGIGNTTRKASPSHLP